MSDLVWSDYFDNDREASTGTYGGNMSEKEQQIDRLRSRVMVTLTCSDCHDQISEFGANELAGTAYKHGWAVQDDELLCPECAEEFV